MRKIWKGDKVEVISGAMKNLASDSRIGSVLRVDSAKNHVYISGVNMRKVTQKRSQENPQGSLVERECPIHISNVKVIEKSPEHLADEERKKKNNK